MLPIRPIALPEESPGSIFLRAAAANGWKPSNLLRAHGNNDWAKYEIGTIIGSPRRALQLADRLGIDRAEIGAVLYPEQGPTGGELYCWHGLSVRATHLRWHHPAVCPSCLAADEYPYARSLWDHRLVTSCLTHRQRLLDTCPECKAALSWDRPDIAICKCGYDLRMGPLVPANPAEHEIVSASVAARDDVYLDRAMRLLLTLQELHGCGGLSICAFDLSAALLRVLKAPRELVAILAAGVPGRGLAPRVAIRRLLTQGHESYTEEVLAGFDAAGYANIPGNWDSVLTSEISHAQAAALCGLTEVVAGKCLRKLQDHIGEGRRPTLDQVNRLLLRFYPLNAAPLDGSARVRVLRGVNIAGTYKEIELGNAWAATYNHIDGLASAQVAFSVRPFTIPADRMTLLDIARRARVHYESIRFLVNSGFLSAAPALNGRNQLTVYRSDAEAFLRDYRFAGALADQVGTGRTVFAAKLMSAGLTAVSGPSIDGALTYVFKTAEVEAVDLQRVAAMPHYDARSGRKKLTDFDASTGVTYRRAAEVLECSVPKAKSLVTAGLMVREGSNRRARAITRTSFDEFMTMLRSSDHITTAEAARSVGETEAMFRKRWISTGIIAERNLMLVRQVTQADLQKVVALKAQYVTRREFGASFGKERNHISNQIRIGAMKNDGHMIGTRHKLWLHPRTSSLSEAAGAPGTSLMSASWGHACQHEP